MKYEEIGFQFNCDTTTLPNRHKPLSTIRFLLSVFNDLQNQQSLNAARSLASISNGEHRNLTLSLLGDQPGWALASDIFRLLPLGAGKNDKEQAQILRDTAYDYGKAANTLGLVTCIPVEAALITIRALKNRRQLDYLKYFLTLCEEDYPKLIQECSLNMEALDAEQAAEAAA